MPKQWVIDLVAIIVAATWAVSVALTYIDRDWQPPPTVHLVMLALVGAVIGAKVGKRIEQSRAEDRSDEQREQNGNNK